LPELLEQANTQATAWHDERNRLIIQASALNISARRILLYVGLSGRGSDEPVQREHARVDTGVTET
jgi:hypothetical protein